MCSDGSDRSDKNEDNNSESMVSNLIFAAATRNMVRELVKRDLVDVASQRAIRKT